MEVHVFLGKFKNREEAIRYSEPFWEPEPDESVSDYEYEEWENTNPKWAMRDDLDCSLDSDFIETITEDKFSYLNSILKTPELIAEYENNLKLKETVLILIYEPAMYLSETNFQNPSRIEYIGMFESLL